MTMAHGSTQRIQFGASVQDCYIKVPPHVAIDNDAMNRLAQAGLHVTTLPNTSHLATNTSDSNVTLANYSTAISSGLFKDYYARFPAISMPKRAKPRKPGQLSYRQRHKRHRQRKG